MDAPAHWAGSEPIRILDADGTAVADPDVGLDAERLQAYVHMVRARRLDRECMALQRQGELTVYPPFEGQEAAQVGSAFALGDGTGRSRRSGSSRRRWSAASTRCSTSRTTAGRGTAARTTRGPRGSGRSACPSRRRSATRSASRWASQGRVGRVRARVLRRRERERGDFHEGANLAAVFGAPAILFCQNNGWAISVPTGQQTAGEIWKRAEGLGFPGVRVDGNDVLAVYRVTSRGRRTARAGEGPTLIEALTYRLGPHTTADDASGTGTRRRSNAGAPTTRSTGTGRGCSRPGTRTRRWSMRLTKRRRRG